MRKFLKKTVWHSWIIHHGSAQVKPDSLHTKTKLKKDGLLAASEAFCNRVWVMPCQVFGATNHEKTKELEECRSSLPLTTGLLQKLQPDMWYSGQWVNSSMQEIVTLGGLDCTNKRFSNHSIHKTTVRKLQKAGVSMNVAIQVHYHCHELWYTRPFLQTTLNIKGYAQSCMTQELSLAPLLSSLLRLASLLSWYVCIYKQMEHYHPLLCWFSMLQTKCVANSAVGMSSKYSCQQNQNLWKYCPLKIQYMVNSCNSYLLLLAFY